VIDSKDTPIDAVWLDPISPLSETERAHLGQVGIQLRTVNTLDELNVALKKTHMLVIRLSDNVELLKEVQALMGLLGILVPIVCRVDRRKIEIAVAAMRHGALNVISSEDLGHQVWMDTVKGIKEAKDSANALSSASSASSVASSHTKPASFVFVDPVSQHLLALAQKVAQTDVTVLLVGPTGAGKEVLAKVLHESSPRAKGPFVALNCAALPEHLIEDMLFGHEKGAFTGALKDHKGLFEQAHGGTVFLDEIGEMPIHLQAKLLRVLQERKLNRLGGESAIDLNVRIVAATNKDLRAAIENREFREDLYFRISTFRLTIQPLRERVGDIMPLVLQSLVRHGVPGLNYSVSEEAQGLLNGYRWPGNVRELENVIQRAVVLCPTHLITSDHLMFDESVQSLAAQGSMGGMGGMGSMGSTSGQSAVGGFNYSGNFVNTGSSANNLNAHQGHQGMVNSEQGASSVFGTLENRSLNSPVADITSALARNVISNEGAVYMSHPNGMNTSYLQGNNSLSDDAVNGQAHADLSSAVKASEHLVIMSAIRTSENRIEAAKKLGISPRTLRYKLAQLRDRGMTMSLAE
jgi:two-component system response regulator FlrC